MTFHINPNPTIAQLAELAGLGENTPYADRIGQLGSRDFRLAEDRGRDAFMFMTASIGNFREGPIPDCYLLYFMHAWFDIRSRNMRQVEVRFVDFPAAFERQRKQIERCFGQAARIHGFWGDEPNQAHLFDPVFCDANWDPQT